MVMKWGHSRKERYGLLPTHCHPSHRIISNAGPFCPGLSNIKILLSPKKYFFPQTPSSIVPPLRASTKPCALQSTGTHPWGYHMASFHTSEVTAFPREKKTLRNNDLVGQRSCGLLCAFMGEQELLLSWGEHFGSKVQMQAFDSHGSHFVTLGPLSTSVFRDKTLGCGARSNTFHLFLHS